MKRMLWMAIGALLLIGVSSASAQSLGDVARSARKGKTQQTAPNHKYDNDNLPKNDHLSVVGPTSESSTNGADNTNAQSQNPQQAQASSNAAEDRQKANDEWKDKLDAQKKKVDELAHELDLMQREYKLHSAVVASDAGYRLRNAAMWDKEEADFRKQVDEKQKALDAAKQELSDLQEQARKAGAPAAKESQ